MHQIRRRPALPALLTLCFFAFAAWSRADNRKIDDFRVSVCGSRMERIQEAARQYYTAEGTPPASILALVPEYLPNLQAIHCPVHSLKYDEYCLLGSKDPAEAVNVISYQLDRSISGELVVVHKSAPKEHIRRVENALKPAVLADSRKRHTERSIAE